MKKLSACIGIDRNKGFTLLELAVVLVIIGLLAGGGIALMRTMVASEQRVDTATYMEEIRQVLLTYASIYEKLPAPDTTSVYAKIPVSTLRVPPHDAWGRALKYAVNPNLLVNRTTSCNYLKNTLTIGYTGTEKLTSPEVWDEDGPGKFVVAAVIVSAGASDADRVNNSASETEAMSDFDAITGKGNNYAGSPFLRHRPSDDFDDMVSYISVATLFDWMKCK